MTPVSVIIDGWTVVLSRRYAGPRFGVRFEIVLIDAQNVRCSMVGW
jgi:hypothetical protein